MPMQKPSVKLEDWAVVPSPNTAAYQELRPGNLLVGRAFGHRKIETGSFVFTSAIVRIDVESRVVETRNTSYRLGEPSLGYKAWCQKRAGRTAA